MEDYEPAADAAPEVPGYDVGRCLGRGASATVWLGTERSTGREFALFNARLQGLPEHVHPHMFRHSFASAVLDASGGNLVIARDAGGWASAAMVDEVYGHADVHDPAFDAALRSVWGEQQ